MVMDAAEPRDYEIRALCMECGHARSKKVSIKPENRETEEIAFLMAITFSHEHKDYERWALDWEEVS